MPVPRVRIPPSPLEAAQVSNGQCQKTFRPLKDVGNAVPGGARFFCALSPGCRKVTAPSLSVNDKRVSQDPELSEVIHTWPNLHETIKAGILVLVQAATKPKGTSAQKQEE
jgi:hypothetical protein